MTIWEVQFEGHIKGEWYHWTHTKESSEDGERLLAKARSERRKNKFRLIERKDLTNDH